MDGSRSVQMKYYCERVTVMAHGMSKIRKNQKGQKENGQIGKQMLKSELQKRLKDEMQYY